MFVILLAVFVLANSELASATVIEVPQDYTAITLALEATSDHDTVWVHPGRYDDRLIFPAHDVVLISDYFMTGDSSAIDSTIIDASTYADLDTASVVSIVHGNTRDTFVGGFTLTGGQGTVNALYGRIGGGTLAINSSPTYHSCHIVGNSLAFPSYGFALFSLGGSPLVSHCEIFGNCGPLGLACFFSPLDESVPAVFEWNDVHNNASCDSIQGHISHDNCVFAGSQYIIVRFNRFHDYSSVTSLGVDLNYSWGEVYGNTFERLRVPPDRDGEIIFVSDRAPALHDNVFLDCDLVVGSAMTFAHLQDFNPYRSLVERNWFENITNSIGPPGLYMQGPNADVRDNVFLNCRGRVGVVQFSQMHPFGCRVLFERNHFFYNQAVGGWDVTGSAFLSHGDGPPCTFADNWFEGNEGWAISVDSAINPPLDLSNNYWGDPSGPFHPIENPEGQGDSVSANVHVTPWLTSPPGTNEAIKERLTLHPDEWTLEQAFPNPFNASTTLRLTSSKPQPFEVTAYNTLGQKVASIWRGIVPKDAPTDVHWNGARDRGSVASGIYYLVAIPKGPGAHAPKTAKVVLLR